LDDLQGGHWYMQKGDIGISPFVGSPVVIDDSRLLALNQYLS
jgi:hypothetical protein